MLDLLGDILAPYSELLGKIAGFTASIQVLSLFLLMRDIHVKRSSDSYSFTQFSIGLIMSVLTLKLGSIMEDKAMINSNLLGFVVNIIGTCVFYYYASNEKKSSIWVSIGKTSIFIGACLGYASLLDNKTVEVHFGVLITLMLVALIGGPLLNLPKIIAKKSVEGMPFPLIASGTVTIFAWTLYGISLKNNVLIYQNLILLSMASVQLSLFAIYPSTPPAKNTQKFNKTE